MIPLLLGWSYIWLVVSYHWLRISENDYGGSWKKVYKILWGTFHLASMYQAGYLVGDMFSNS